MPAKRRPKKLPTINDLPAEDQAQSTWSLGHSFERASSVVIGAPNPQSALVSAYLLLHALELFLKSHLIHHNHSDAQLRAIGHDITQCIRACRESNFGSQVALSYHAVRQVLRVNRYYRDKELEYFKPRPKQFGSIEELQATVRAVAKAVLGEIMDAGFAKMYRAAT